MVVTGHEYNKEACLELFTNPLIFHEMFEKLVS